MGCCLGISDPTDVDDELDSWNEPLKGKFVEKWIVPRRTAIVRDTNDGKMSVIKRHATRLSATHELSMMKTGPFIDLHPTLDNTFLSYDFIPGMDLFDFVKNRPYIPKQELYNCCLCVGRAIEHLHARGICHFDVKPENVVLRNGDLRTPVLIDFEFARFHRTWKFDKHLLCDAGRMQGTVGYFSPEMYCLRMAGPPSDVWGFGMLLFTVLHGGRNLDGLDYVDYIQQVADGDALCFRDTIRDLWTSRRYSRNQQVQEINAYTMPFIADPKRRPSMHTLMNILK